ncbi:MAG: hypothetical protein LBJ42_00245, partial [Holosporales bacterium]|nr:hypothetical protein [Holosporales bacterium]
MKLRAGLLLSTIVLEVMTARSAERFTPLERKPIQIDSKLGRIIYVDMRYPVMRKDRLTIAETKEFVQFM